MSQWVEFFRILRLAAPFVSMPAPENQHPIRGDRKRLKGQAFVTCVAKSSASEGWWKKSGTVEKEV